MQTIRERTPELAVLKSLGFTDRAVFLMVLAEALVTYVAAALTGLALAWSVFPYAAKFVAGLGMPLVVIAVGVIAAVLVALISAAVPAMRAARLQVTDALAGGKEMTFSETVRRAASHELRRPAFANRAGLHDHHRRGVHRRRARLHARDGCRRVARSDGHCTRRSGRRDERRLPSPNQSRLTKEVAASIHDLPGIRRNAKGEPIALSAFGVFVQARARGTVAQWAFRSSA